MSTEHAVHPTILRTTLLTVVAMLAFASNSVLGRLALAETGIDPASFTLVRIASGAAVLALIVAATARNGRRLGGSWRGAAALFGYAITFSFAYLSIPTGAGALLLFGAVQATMIITGLVRGERLSAMQWLGLALAFTGLAALLAPGVSAPPLLGSALMVMAGIAWGAYSLLGRGAPDATGATAGNFVRATPMAVAVAAVMLLVGGVSVPDAHGLLYAVISGGITSGLGYAIWYAALPGLTAARAASVQLSVPVIASIGGALVVAEPITLRLALSSLAVLGGIALVIRSKRR